MVSRKETAVWLVPAQDIDYLVENKSSGQIQKLLLLLLGKFKSEGALESFRYLVQRIVECPEATQIDPYSYSIAEIPETTEFNKLTNEWSEPGSKLGRNPTKLEQEFFEVLLELGVIDFELCDAVSRKAALKAPSWFYEQLVNDVSVDSGDGWQPSSHQALANNPNVSSLTLKKLWESHDISNGGQESLTWVLAGNPNCPHELLTQFARSEGHIWDEQTCESYGWADGIAEDGNFSEGFVRYQSAINPSTPEVALRWLSSEENAISQEACKTAEHEELELWAFEINLKIVLAASENLKSRK